LLIVLFGAGLSLPISRFQGGKIKVVYTVSVHHNPTGITMSNEKRVRLLALAKQYNFIIISGVV
jgi:DNA-binding transcriptional MocR family regulator